MPDYRKPPVEKVGRSEAAPPDSDSLEFSIESTTMRLKSLKVRRTEAADKALDAHLRAEAAKTQPPPAPKRADGPAGRIRHDERGMAVWDWAAAAGEVAALSATNVMRKLDVADLKIEETLRTKKIEEPVPRDPGGGGDPYNQRTPAGGKGGDPYNQKVASSRPAPVNRPAPAAPAPAKKPGGSVLDQLLGKKK